MNKCSFWYESDRGGAVFRFLLSIGVVFAGGCMTPPPPSFHGWLTSIHECSYIPFIRALGKGLSRSCFSFWPCDPHVLDEDVRGQRGVLRLPPVDVLPLPGDGRDVSEHPEGVVADADILDRAFDLPVLYDEGAVPGYRGEVADGIVLEAGVPGVGEVEAVPDLAEELLTA